MVYKPLTERVQNDFSFIHKMFDSPMRISSIFCFGSGRITLRVNPMQMTYLYPILMLLMLLDVL